MTETAHQVNGPASPSGRYIDTIDPDDPEYIREKRRPAGIQEDVQQMEDRKRVSIVLNSETFREELEQIVHEQLKSGGHPANLLALQQITDLLLPHSGQRYGSGGFRTSPVIPISDIRGMESMGYTRPEKVLRCKLAACYRLVDIFGWTHGIFNHITARINQEREHFLINPFGLLYSEITASSLVKVDMRGEVIDPGSSTLGINKAGFFIHSAIHQARPDIRCIIHLHTSVTTAVSVMKCGLLPLSQEALICGNISYHDYNGIVVDTEEREKLARDLGPTNKVMFLRNHGVVACGESIEEAFHYAYNLMSACESQLKAVQVGMENLILVDSETQKKTFATGSVGGGGVDTSGRKWKTGELEFEALMRMLDNCGLRTGYIYRHPLIKQERDHHSTNDIEVPPSSSSFTYVFDGDIEHSKFVSPLRQALERQKQQHKVGWLNSPNTYIKQEIDEIGTPNPKKITKWVSGDSSATAAGTHVKVESPNQFAPQGSNPKEFKERQKKIRHDYYVEKVTAGPQSKVLEGVTWEEAQKVKDGNLSGTSDSVVVIGAASKGIIKRDQQHNAVVYKSYYTPNPFENVTSDELEKYKQQVEHGGIDLGYSEPAPDGQLISTKERMQHIQQQAKSDTEEKSDVEAEPVAASPTPIETSINDVIDEKLDGNSSFQSPPAEPFNAIRPHGPRKDVDLLPESIPTVLITDVNSAASRVVTIQRTESDRQPPSQKIEEKRKQNLERSKSDRRLKPGEKTDDNEKPGSPAKSDTMRSTDSASGGDTLDERSSKEGSPTKEHPSSTDIKKKKKRKFRIPSFSSKKKNKE